MAVTAKRSSRESTITRMNPFSFLAFI